MRPHFSSPGNQGDSPGQPLKRSLRAGTCVRYNYSVQLVAIWRARVPKRNNIFPEGGWKLVVHIAVREKDIALKECKLEIKRRELALIEQKKQLLGN